MSAPSNTELLWQDKLNLAGKLFVIVFWNCRLSSTDILWRNAYLDSKGRLKLIHNRKFFCALFSKKINFPDSLWSLAFACVNLKENKQYITVCKVGMLRRYSAAALCLPSAELRPQITTSISHQVLKCRLWFCVNVIYFPEKPCLFISRQEFQSKLTFIHAEINVALSEKRLHCSSRVL